MLVSHVQDRNNVKKIVSPINMSTKLGNWVIWLLKQALAIFKAIAIFPKEVGREQETLDLSFPATTYCYYTSNCLAI